MSGKVRSLAQLRDYHDAKQKAALEFNLALLAELNVKYSLTDQLVYQLESRNNEKVLLYPKYDQIRFMMTGKMVGRRGHIREHLIALGCYNN